MKQLFIYFFVGPLKVFSKLLFLVIISFMAAPLMAQETSQCANLIGKYRVKSRESMVFFDVTQEGCSKVTFHTHFGVSKDYTHQEMFTDGKEYLVYDDGSKRIYRTAEFTDLLVGNGEKVQALHVFNAYYDDSQNGKVSEVESYFYAREYPKLKSLTERRDHLTEKGGYYYRLYLGYVDDFLEN